MLIQLLTLLAGPAVHAAETETSGSYSFGTFRSDVATIPREAGLLAASIGVVGIASWDWGNDSFHFNDEGFWGDDTGSLGMDKLGHAYSTYVMGDYLFHFMKKNNASSYAPYSAASLAWGMMLGVEAFDGFSTDHGFSYEDLIFNLLGAGFSVIRNTVPGLRDKLDFRLEYIPSQNKGGFHPITDYSGQKYLLALKFSGFKRLKDTPLRFVEFHCGFFARGFTDAEEERGEPLRREPYVAVSLNLSELLFGETKIGKTGLGYYAKRFLEYVQIPYTYVATERE